MANEDIVKYLTENSDFPTDTLVDQLLSSGYSQTAINEALSEINKASVHVSAKFSKPIFIRFGAAIVLSIMAVLIQIGDWLNVSDNYELLGFDTDNLEFYTGVILFLVAYLVAKNRWSRILILVGVGFAVPLLDLIWDANLPIYFIDEDVFEWWVTAGLILLGAWNFRRNAHVVRAWSAILNRTSSRDAAGATDLWLRFGGRRGLIRTAVATVAVYIYGFVFGILHNLVETVVSIFAILTYSPNRAEPFAIGQVQSIWQFVLIVMGMGIAGIIIGYFARKIVLRFNPQLIFGLSILGSLVIASFVAVVPLLGLISFPLIIFGAFPLLWFGSVIFDLAEIGGGKGSERGATQPRGALDSMSRRISALIVLVLVMGYASWPMAYYTWEPMLSVSSADVLDVSQVETLDTSDWQFIEQNGVRFRVPSDWEVTGLLAKSGNHEEYKAALRDPGTAFPSDEGVYTFEVDYMGEGSYNPGGFTDFGIMTPQGVTYYTHAGSTGAADYPEFYGASALAKQSYRVQFKVKRYGYEWNPTPYAEQDVLMRDTIFSTLEVPQ